MNASIPYAYIVTTSFSGSTLLAILLDTHPKVVSISELDNGIAKLIEAGEYREFPCSCGKPIRQWEFFRQVQEHCADSGVELDLHNFRTRLGPGLGSTASKVLFGVPGNHFWLQRARDTLIGLLPRYRRHVQEVLDRSEVIARAVLEVSGKEVFVDGSKIVARPFYLLKRTGLDLRLIHIVRDVRALIHSCVKRGLADIPATARYWARTHSAALRLKQLVGPDRYTMFRWEDFCKQPERTLNHLCSFINVGPAELVSVVDERPHHIIGNAMRLRPVESIRYDETWREVLTPQQLAICDRIAGKLNRSFGYE